jgi:hypothetical protein
MIPFPRETHKLEPEGVKYLIDLTLAGYSVAEIIKAIKDAYGVTITDQGVFYHRRVHRKSLMVGITEDIAAARAVYPEAALLVGRLGNLDKALKKEMAKKKVSGYAVAALVAEQTNAMHKAETLQLRLMEFEKRYPTGKDDEAERVLRELERRSHVLRNVTEEVETIQKIAGGDFEPDAIPVEAEVVQGGAEDPPAEKTLAAELDAEELGEDALTT